MTGADLLCAISAADEKYANDSGQFSVVAAAIKADRKKNLQRFAAIGIAAVLCIAVFGAVKSMPQFFKMFTPSDTTTIQTPNWNDPTATTLPPAITSQENSTEEDVGSTHSEDQVSTTKNGNEHPAASTENPTRPEPTSIADRQEPSVQTPQTEVPSTTKKADTPTVPSMESVPSSPSAEPSSVVATTIVNQEEPQTVYQDVTVDHETAKMYFKHPIVPCNRNDFNGYNVLLGSPDGNINSSETTCLSVTYLFTNGSIDLRDQDRTGEIYPTGNSYSYDGRTFYVHTPEFNGDPLRVAYFPTGSSGIAYQASFGSNTDVNLIMDIIISLEL